MAKLFHFFVISLLIIGFLSSLYVFKVSFAFPTPTIQEEVQTHGWHTVETWTLFAVTSSVFFVIRAIDVFACACNQDDDFEKGLARYYLWSISKAKRKLHRWFWKWSLILHHRHSISKHLGKP
jgi:hypothetical protein